MRSFLIVLDCFTNGKGDRSEIFAAFYQKHGAPWPYRIIRVEQPADPDRVAEAIYSLQANLSGDGQRISFEETVPVGGGLDVGQRIKSFRKALKTDVPSQ